MCVCVCASVCVCVCPNVQREPLRVADLGCFDEGFSAAASVSVWRVMLIQ